MVMGDALTRRIKARRGSRVLLVGFLLSGSAFFAACTTPSAEDGAGVASDTPKYGGVLRQSRRGDPPHLDPQDTLAASFHTSGPGVVYSRLIRLEYSADFEPGTKIVYPDLAESWTQVNDTTIVFNLRKGVKWHNTPPVNGRELVADDVVFSYERQREPGRPNIQQLAAVDTIKATDKYTVNITLKKPNADFFVDFADQRNKVVAPEAVALRGDLKAGPTIGTGPWILEKTERGVGHFFNRNPDYFEQGLPYLDRWEIYTGLGDAAATASAFRTKQLDFLQLEPEQLASVLRTNPDVQQFTSIGDGSGGWPQLALKQDRPPFNNLKVRQAVNKALDRQQIIAAAWDGTGVLGLGINLTVGPSWRLSDAEFEAHYKRDVAAAKRLLAEAGYPNGLDMHILVGPLAQGFVTSAELVEAQLREANIRARLEVIDYPRWTVQATQQGDFPSAALGPISMLPTTNASLYGLMYCKASRNVYAVCDPELDRMIDAQATEFDAEKRKKMVQDIQRYILKNEYMTNLRVNQSFTVAWPYLRNFRPNVATYEDAMYFWVDQGR